MNSEKLDIIKKLVDNKLAEKIIRNAENDPNIKVHEIDFTFATAKGDNYTSEMFRITLEYSRSNSNKTERKSVIIKCEPFFGLQKDMITRSDFFATEISMITDSLAKMNELLRPESRLCARGLHVQENPTLLAIEDLTPLGFRMADRIKSLDIDHCLMALRGLAKFHASSVALCEKEPSLKQRYIHGMFHRNQSTEIKQFFIETAKNFCNDVVNWPELDPKISEKVSKLADRLIENGYLASVVRENEFNVINHGDFWINNMLFKLDDKNKPIDIIFVDFQLCVYSSPAMDLQYFFHTSLKDEVLLENQEKFFEEYLRMLTSVMIKLKCKVKPPTMEELKRMYIDRSAIGLLASFTILPMTMADKDDCKDLNEIISSSDANSIFKGKFFRKVICNRLSMFDKMGLLN